MAQARWNGVDGMDERTRAPYWRIGMRHALADAARGYDWSRVLRVLTEYPDCVNASRPGGRARYAPLHQAAHGGAPASVVRRLLDLGAWRTLRTRGGERPVDIARRRGHSRVIPMLMPAYRRRRVPLDDLRRMQRHFHAVIREHPPGRRPCLRLPEIEPLLEMGRERVYFEVPGMFGGFEYWLEDDGVVPRLRVETFRRIINCDLRYEVTPHGWRLVDEFDRGPEFRPVSNPSTAPRTTALAGPRSRTRRPPRPAARAGGPPTPGSERVPLPKEEQAKHTASGRVESPALASIRLASGETGYVELSPEGRRRLAVAEGAIVQFSNRDVAERHRDHRGIRWMSLNRLMRLREEGTVNQRSHSSPSRTLRRDSQRPERGTADARNMEPSGNAERLSTRQFDMAQEIVDFALTKHDRSLFHGGRRTNLVHHDELSAKIDECDDWYSWRIDESRLHTHTGVELTSDTLCDKNVELKWALHERFKGGDCDEKQRLVRCYVGEWGGIRRNSEETMGAALFRRRSREVQEGLRAAWRGLLDPAKAG